MDKHDVFKPLEIIGVDKEFEELTKGEARRYFNIFLKQIPQRIAELQKYIQVEWESELILDFTPESLRLLWEGFMKHVEIVFPIKCTERAVYFDKRNKDMVLINDWRNPYSVSKKTFLLLDQMGMYLGEIILLNHEQMYWDILRGSKMDCGVNEPTLEGMYPPGYHGDLDPLGVARKSFSGEVDKHFFNKPSRFDKSIYGAYIDFIKRKRYIECEYCYSDTDIFNIHQSVNNFVQIVNNRVQLLIQYIFQNSNELICPHTEHLMTDNELKATFKLMWKCFDKPYRVRWYHQKEMEHFKENLSKHQYHLTETYPFELREQSRSMAWDIGLYMCNELIRRYSHLHWGKAADCEEWVLRGFADDDFHIHPMYIAKEAILRTQEKNNVNIFYKLYHELEKRAAKLK